MTIPLPDVPDTGKITDGNDRMSETRQALNTLYARITPVTLGGTGGTTKATARSGLGITSGTANPSGGTDGDVYFKIV
jgi:hypothetical protein